MEQIIALQYYQILLSHYELMEVQYSAIITQSILTQILTKDTP